MSAFGGKADITKNMLSGHGLVYPSYFRFDSLTRYDASPELGERQ